MNAMKIRYKKQLVPIYHRSLIKPISNILISQLFISKLYKDNVEAIDWNIDKNLKIKKKEIGLEEYEYTTEFYVSQDVKLKDGQSETNKYKVQTRIDPTGKIVEFNMIKILE